MRHKKYSSAYSYLKQNNGKRYSSMVFKSFLTKEIISLIKSLKTKNSSDYGEIHTELLKIGARYICSQLTYICNKSISAGIFPELLHYSILKPLYKKGDKTDLLNFRTVSWLTSFSKVFEKALYIRLTEHINKNNMLVGQQFGFSKTLAMDDAIFILTQEFLNALKDREMVGGIFYDLEKGFDSVSHSLLIKKTFHIMV